MNPLFDYLTNAVRKMVRNSKGVIFHENKRNALLYKFGKINGEWKYLNELDVQTDEDEIVRIIVENMMSTLESEYTFKTFPPEQEYPHLMKCGCVKAPAKKTIARKPVRKTPAKKTVRR